MIHRVLPPLITKAITDAGYDLLTPAGDGWVATAVSGRTGCIFLIRVYGDDVLLAWPEPDTAQRIGLAEALVPAPTGMTSVGIARSASQLYEALRLLQSLQVNSFSALTARVAARFAKLSETERTQEVRRRIGQEVFRESLIDLWEGRCALSGMVLPSPLLRASHAKPWAAATDAERLDPFNGLLLSVHLDSMFDVGLISFGVEGDLLCSPSLAFDVRQHFHLRPGQKLRSLKPAHAPYLAWHRQFVAGL